MLELLDPAALDPTVERIASATARPGSVVFVSGPPGAGRSRLLAALSAADPTRYVVAQAPEASEPDGPLHTALQIALQAREDTASLVAELLGERRTRCVGQRVAAALGKADQVLVLRLPTSWLHAPVVGRESEQFLSRASDLLRGISECAPLRIVVLASTTTEHLRRTIRGEHPQSVRLPPAQVRRDALDDAARWGPYADAADIVCRRLDGAQTRPTAFGLGLAVAIQALSSSPSKPVVDAREDLDALLARLARRLAEPRHDALRNGLRRIALARFPVDTEAALQIGDIPAEHRVLVTQCVGYEAAPHRLRFTDTIREALRRLDFGPGEDLSLAHAQLGAQFEARDGVRDPRGTTASTIVPWLEATHHFAWAGSREEAKWQARALACDTPEFFWDRARALSIQDQRYGEAAEVYRTCAERFPSDHYARHYYAWNLDRAGDDVGEIERGFREAIGLQPDNAWYNSRLVTFMVRTGRFVAAEQEFEAALDRLDPERVRAMDDEHLVRGFHISVTRAWLDAGDVVRARRAFDTIGAALVDESTALRELAWRLADAEEASALGTSVYPAGVRIEDRWRKPAGIPDVLEGRPLATWFPARILELEDDSVEIALATVVDDPGQRQVLHTRLTFEQWREMTGGEKPSESRRHWSLARYGDVSRLFFNGAAPPPWHAVAVAGPEPLRYLKQWAPRR